VKWRAVALAVVVISAVGCQARDERTCSVLEGVWRIVEYRVTGPDVDITNPDPQPSLYMFDRRHYSVVRIPTSERPRDFEMTWRPTDEEKVRAFNSIIVNAGTYELTDSTLTTRPFIAKTPEFMGGWAVSRYSFANDTLSLETLEIYSHDGVPD